MAENPVENKFYEKNKANFLYFSWQSESEKNYKQFMIVKPSLTEDQCHPEEGVYGRVNEDIWRTHMMDDGVIEDDYQVRKVVIKPVFAIFWMEKWY